jgi:pilus assembly protein CpaB
MGRWRTVIPIVLAALIALIGSFLTYRWVKIQMARAPVQSGEVLETADIAVAKVDLPWGTKLSKEHFNEQFDRSPYLKKSLPAGAFENLDDLDGRVVIVPVKQQQPVLESSLAPVSVRTGGVSAILGPGKRALAVKGDKVIGLSGFILPGNRVDVFVTLTDPKNEEEVTKLVLQDIPVLATGTEMQENSKGEPMPVDVYTLEVTPDDGEKLSLAASKGQIQLALRNPMDTETVLTEGANATDTLNSFQKVVPARPKPVNKPVKRGEKPFTRSVEVIKGNVVSGETF